MEFCSYWIILKDIHELCFLLLYLLFLLHFQKIYIILLYSFYYIICVWIQKSKNTSRVAYCVKWNQVMIDTMYVYEENKIHRYIKIYLMLISALETFDFLLRSTYWTSKDEYILRILRRWDFRKNYFRLLSPAISTTTIEC